MCFGQQRRGLTALGCWRSRWHARPSIRGSLREGIPRNVCAAELLQVGLDCLSDFCLASCERHANGKEIEGWRK
jgi:hypothetical protein